jgi:hypothetical protein
MGSDYQKRMAAQKADRLERQAERRNEYAAHKEKEKLLYKELKNEYDAQHVKNMVDAREPDAYMGNYVPSHEENSAVWERKITRKAAGGRVGKSYRGYGAARCN